MEEDEAGANAMSEIALALAMAIFSLLILAMVSMGAGNAAQQEEAKATLKVAAVMLQPASEKESHAVVTLTEEDTLVVHFRSKLRNQALQAIQPESLRDKKRVVVAVDPTYDARTLMAIRAAIPAHDVALTFLNQAWLNRLAQEEKKS